MSARSSTEFDAIVVGTGPGGATVAKELSARKQKVLVLEAGGEPRMDDTLASHLKVMRLQFIGRGVPLVRGITTGGSSTLYCACAFDPPVDMFRSYGIDLSEEVEEVRRELPVEPLPDRLTGPKARRIMAGAQALGYDWKKLNKFVFQDRCDGNVPYDAKWNARAFVRESQRNGATLRTGARVHRVLADGRRAVGVEYSERGRRHTVYADKIIVAAGGIGSPVILRASGIRPSPRGFFCDPTVLVSGSVEDIRGPLEAQMTAGMLVHDEGYMLADLTLQPYLFAVLAAQVLRFDRLLAHPGALTIMVKAKDSIGGTITETGRVRRVFDREDTDKLKRGCERAKAILEKAGATQIFRTGCVAAHPGATAAVKDVVDSDLRTELENLYVCDCSVIPEAWGRPPTYTLIALGKRLAKHLTRTPVSRERSREAIPV